MESRMVSFRADDELIAAIAEKAQQEQRSVSDLLRSLVRDAVGEQAAAEAQLPVHTRAAFGDGAALSQLAGMHYSRAMQGDEMAIIALARASDYARLAAIRTNGRNEHIAFIFLLERHAEALRREGLNTLANIAQAEAVAIAEHMGEAGDEEIGQLVVAAGKSLSPEVLDMARQLHGIGIGVTA